MERLGHKEGILLLGGQEVTDSMRALITALSVCTGNDTKTTCDLLNQILQSFDMLVNGLQEVLQALREAFTEASQDICGPCRHRRTRHGSSIKQITPKQAKTNIKWQEKYRPP